MKPLPSYIEEALHKPIDYSTDFTARVSSLRGVLSKELGVPFAHDAGMDYSPAQFVSFVCGASDVGEKSNYSFEVRYYISSRANLFAVYVFDKKLTVVGDRELNHPIDTGRLPPRVQEVIARGDAVLQESGYREVGFEFFKIHAPGCETQMDGLPANIFETLFTEIV
ncbi:hypothetical protein [Burkholderia sp. GS2Y]|uniref:Uncharacterized protein n=1 Tax=Burkholderia theae TaxID=3143496 RepID=A0ABU9WIA4_9BURK